MIDFSGVKILVVGDPIWDYYSFGHVDRMSPEAPVPVFIKDSFRVRNGGAANVAHQLHVLGCDINCGWPKSGWTIKHRYMVGGHQLLRVDQDECVPNVIPAFDGFNAIVISDYAKGACTPEICSQVIQSGIPVIVDPKGKDWTKYQGCRVICPNHLEYQPWDGDVVEKRGAKGIRLHIKGIPPTDFDSHAKHVFDVTGAGDTVTAVIAACIAKGYPLPMACSLASIAAAHVVSEVGTTVCSIEKLRELLAAQ